MKLVHAHASLSVPTKRAKEATRDAVQSVTTDPTINDAMPKLRSKLDINLSLVVKVARVNH